MKRAGLAVMAVCWMSGLGFARHKPPKPDISIVRDVPLGKTFYLPTNRPQLEDKDTRWEIYPYLGQNADSSIYFGLNIDVTDYSGSYSKLYPGYFADIEFVADGKDELPLNIRPDTISEISRYDKEYAFTGSATEKIVRRLADAQEVWLVAYSLGDRVRNNVKLSPEVLQSFKLIIAEYEHLQNSSNPFAAAGSIR